MSYVSKKSSTVIGVGIFSDAKFKNVKLLLRPSKMFGIPTFEAKVGDALWKRFLRSL